MAVAVGEHYLRCVAVGQQAGDLLIGELVAHELQRHCESADMAFRNTGIADDRVSAAYRADMGINRSREEAVVCDELFGLVIDPFAILIHELRSTDTVLAVAVEPFHFYLICHQVAEGISGVESFKQEISFAGDCRFIAYVQKKAIVAEAVESIRHIMVCQCVFRGCRSRHSWMPSAKSQLVVMDI